MSNIDFTIESKDLEVLFLHTKGAYRNMSFENWKKESEKSYTSYFENKEIFKYKKYSYSQWVNRQIISLSEY